MFDSPPVTADRPLAGLKVLDLSRLLPGPFLTLILADLGADVVKIEDPSGGDYLRWFPPSKGDASGRFLAINRGKRSVILDLKVPQGRDVLLKLVERADVLVETFRPGVMDRLGIGYARLRDVNPQLIYCAISGYGQSGPYARRAGHDLNYLALAGVLSLSARLDEATRGLAMPPVQIADLAGGALWGAVGVLGALVGRQTTGCGRMVDIGMTEGAMALMAAEQGHLDAGGEPSLASEGLLNGGVACYASYRTSDGKFMSLGALEPKFWMAFNQAVGRSADGSEVTAPPEVQARLKRELADLFATRTQAEWTAFFADKDVCCEPVLPLAEALQHPQHLDRKMIVEIDDPRRGRLAQLRLPVGQPGDRPPPGFGEHTRSFLSEAGFSEEELALLVAAGATVAQPPG
jgi:crotonobetainyl-CoA:carnitine CoA-transferase CaiB-like acyl-CoA transferase